jgi:hypothetical protein
LAKLSLKQASTSVILQIFIQDSSSTVGAGLAGLTNASGSLTAYYHKDVDTTATVISLVTMTVGTFTSSGFKEIDATNMPGWYQFCPPNTALSTGKSVAIHLKGATNMAPVPLEIELTQVDNQDGTAFGVSRIDAAVSSRMATFTLPTNFSSFSIDGSGRVVVITNSDKTGYSLTQTFPTNFATQVIDASGRVDVSKVSGTSQTATDLGAHVPSGLKKNAARSGFSWFMASSVDHVTGKTGLTVTATVSIDGAAFAGLTNAPTEIGSGWYTVNLSAADTNGNNLAFMFTGAGADATNILATTTP